MKHETIECVGGPMDGGIYAVEQDRETLGFKVDNVIHLYYREESFANDKKVFIMKYNNSVPIPKKGNTNEGQI